MSNPEENEEYLISLLDNLCSKLNVDPFAAKRASVSFFDIKRNYTLDVSLINYFTPTTY